jgi:hypothetical protein
LPGAVRAAVWRTFAFVLVAGGSSACGDPAVRTYNNNDLTLVTGYAAKDMCSCLFVMRQSEAYCRAWTRASPAVNTTRVDWEARAVESQAAVFFGARARYVDRRRGCVLE